MNSQEQKQYSQKTKYLLKALVYILELSALCLIVYLVVLPFYLPIKYKVNTISRGLPEAMNIEVIKKDTENVKKSLPQNDYAVSGNRIILKKIGVNAPIIESSNSEYGLSMGSWRIPESSTPDQGGNTVITGHRFKYLPPNNLTFFLLDKMEIGDIFSLIYNKKDYYYKVIDVKIVPKTDLSILRDSEDTIITLFTCHPIYSMENRLVVIGELIEVTD